MLSLTPLKVNRFPTEKALRQQLPAPVTSRIGFY
jgi:hypothetical protein